MLGQKVVKERGNGHKPNLKAKIVRWLLKGVSLEELHIGAHSIIVTSDVIKMNALAADPGAPAEGWIWHLAGVAHKPRFHNGTENKDIGEGAEPGVHDLGGDKHGADTLAHLNDKVSDATLDDSGASRTPSAHNLGGAEHNADTLANLNTKVSDGDLDKTTDTRDPNAHKVSHQAAGGDELDLTGMKADSLAEKTADAGVTIDTCLIKDGKVADSLLLEGSNKAAVQNHAPQAHDKSVHSDIDQSLLKADNVEFAQVTVGDLVMKNGFRFTEHPKYGVALKSPKGELYKLLLKKC